MLAILHNILCGFGHVRGGLKSSIGLLNHKERGSKSKGKGFFFSPHIVECCRQESK